MTADPLQILVVCTANQCRSQAAEGILRHLASQNGLELDIRSAGTDATPRHPPTSSIIDAAKRADIDISQALSTPLDEQLVAEADLILCAERDHVVSVATLDQGSLGRTFTINELAGRLSQLSDDRGETGTDPTAPTSLVELLERLNNDRSPAGVLAGGSAYDTEDPTGRSRRRHRALVTELTEQLTPTVKALAMVTR